MGSWDSVPLVEQHNCELLMHNGLICGIFILPSTKPASSTCRVEAPASQRLAPGQDVALRSGCPFQPPPGCSVWTLEIEIRLFPVFQVSPCSRPGCSWDEQEVSALGCAQSEPDPGLCVNTDPGGIPEVMATLDCIRGGWELWVFYAD